MSSGRPKATAKKVQGASKSIWYKWFIQSDFSENKKKHVPLVIFGPFSLLCGARSANPVSNLSLVSP